VKSYFVGARTDEWNDTTTPGICISRPAISTLRSPEGPEVLWSKWGFAEAKKKKD